MRDIEDQVLDGCVLPQFAVDPRLNTQRSCVVDLVGGDEHGADRAVGGRALADEELHVPLLQITNRDVVDDGVAVDVRGRVCLGHLVPAGAEDHAELALVITCRGSIVADAHVVAGSCDRRQRLGEDHRRVGHGLLGGGVEAAAREFARMLVVVLADAHDVVTRPDRGEQTNSAYRYPRSRLLQRGGTL